MKTITLAIVALLTSTSLFASNSVTPAARLEARKAAFATSAAAPSTTTNIRVTEATPSASEAAVAKASKAMKETLARLNQKKAGSSSAGVNEGEGEESENASICLMERIENAYEGSTCLANLYLGLLNLAATQCGVSVVEVVEVRAECGLR